MRGDYIFVTGAPGSRWSGYVEDHIYVRDDIDTTDRSPDREYRHGSDKKFQHRGAYFDPLMEYPNEDIFWDRPFSGTGTRVIKSHTFAYQLTFLKKYGYPIHLVYRPNQECFDWWHRCGGWDISYPSYEWYRDDENLMEQITIQNLLIKEFVEKEGLEKHNDGKRDYYIWLPTTENG